MKIIVDSYGKVLETTSIDEANRQSSDWRHRVVFKNKADIRKALLKGLSIFTPAWAMGDGYHRWQFKKKIADMGGSETVSCFGWGQGWQDQRVTFHLLERAVDYIWRNRRGARISNYKNEIERREDAC